MGDYSQAAEFYDLLYSAEKNYAAEAAVLADLIRECHPSARRVLDVACGTGQHAEQLGTLGFTVDGVDLEPTFIAIAAARCPTGSFRVGDMTALSLPHRYDAILSLFSSIGYARTLPRLHQSLAGMAAQLEPDGVLIVDPWFEPGQLTDRWISATTGAADGVAVCRMSRTTIEGAISTLELEYLIGTPDGIDTRAERHELGLFTQAQMESAFRDAGLRVERRLGVLRRRGVYVGRFASGPRTTEGAKRG